MRQLVALSVVVLNCGVEVWHWVICREAERGRYGRRGEGVKITQVKQDADHAGKGCK